MKKDSIEKFFSKWIDFSEKHFVLLLVLFISLFIFELFYLKSDFKMNSDLKAMFKGTNKTVISLEQLSKKMGSESSLLVVAKSPDTEKNIAFMTKLKSVVEKSPLVRLVDFERDIKYLEDHSLLYLSMDELTLIEKDIRKKIADEVSKHLTMDDEEVSPQDENEKKNNIDANARIDAEIDKVLLKMEDQKKKYNISRYFTAENGKFVAMKIRPSGSDTSIEETKKLISFVEHEANKLNPAKEGIEFEAGGSFRNKLSEVKSVQSDLFSTIGLCIALLAFCIIYYYRSLFSVFIIFLPLSIGVVSAISSTLFILGEFNLISAFSFAVIYGLGIDFAIHLLTRYSEEKENGAKSIDAMKRTYKAIVPAILSGALTTAAAFFSIFFIEFKGFSDFGLVAGVGVVTSLIAILLFFPIIVFYFEKASRGIGLKTRKVRILETSYLFMLKHYKILIPLYIVAIIISCYSLFKIPFQYDFDELTFPKKEDSSLLTVQYQKSSKKENRDVGSSSMASYIFTNSLEETEDAVKALEKMKNDPKNKIQIKAITSIFTFVPFEQDEKLKKIASIKRLIERKINLFDEKVQKKVNEKLMPLLSIEEKITIDKLPVWITDKFKEKNGQIGKIIQVNLGGNKSSILSVVEIKNLYSQIKGELKTYDMVASYFLLADIKDVINKDVPLAITLAILVVFIILLLTFRSFKDAVIVILPLFAGMILMIGVAWILGVKLNLFNMIVIPTIVGIGIDSSIHIFHRYKHSGGADKFPLILRLTGGAVLYSSITTFIGFGSLLTATHKGLQSLGNIASIGIATVTITSLLFFPVVIAIFNKKKI